MGQWSWVEDIILSIYRSTGQHPSSVPPNLLSYELRVTTKKQTKVMKECTDKYGKKRKRSKATSCNKPTLSATKTSNEEKNHESQQLVPKVVGDDADRKKVFFIIDNASLGKIQIKNKKVWRVAHSVDDATPILNQKKNLDNFRSDIVHEALKGIIDSPLCKNGMVGGIYVKIENGVLFQVKPHIRITRTLPRFCGVMLELLNKSSVRAKETNEKLFQVIEEPVTRHLPPNSQIIGISADSKKVVDIDNYVSASNHDRNLVFMVGASPQGKINEEFVGNIISVSNYKLSPRGCIELICDALENKWNIF